MLNQTATRDECDEVEVRHAEIKRAERPARDSYRSTQASGVQDSSVPDGLGADGLDHGSLDHSSRDPRHHLVPHSHSHKLRRPPAARSRVALPNEHLSLVATSDHIQSRLLRANKEPLEIDSTQAGLGADPRAEYDEFGQRAPRHSGIQPTVTRAAVGGESMAQASHAYKREQLASGPTAALQPVPPSGSLDASHNSDSALSSTQIFELVYRQMRSLAGRSAADFDDLVQVAAEQVLKSRSSYRGECIPSTWTYRICYRVLLRHRRSLKRWLVRFSMTRDGVLPEPMQEELFPDPFRERERLTRLHRALDQLSPKLRAVVVLADLEEVSVDEIARIVNAKSNTVRSRLRDGRHKLATILQDDPYFGEGDKS